jgi:peptidoglycan/xylan/chitin deacetylase (PgdA/CDA1 family)
LPEKRITMIVHSYVALARFHARLVVLQMFFLVISILFFPFNLSASDNTPGTRGQMGDEASQKAGNTPSESPEKTVKEFYKAIADKNCKRASELRPGYASSKCSEIEGLSLRKAEQRFNRDGVSVVYLEIAYKERGAAKSFSGHVKLERRSNKWVIVSDSYNSTSDLKSYLKKYNLERQSADGLVKNRLTPSSVTAQKANPELGKNAGSGTTAVAQSAESTTEGTGTPGRDAEKVVQDFFQAVNDGDCAKAALLRPGYKESACKQARGMSLKGIKRRSETALRVIVDVVLGKDTGQEVRIAAMPLQLTFIGGRWIIDDSIAISGDSREHNTVEKLAPSPSERSNSTPLPSSPGLTFGSRAVLETCWTPEELKAIPGEEVVRKPVPVTLPSPVRVYPKNHPVPSPLSAKMRNSIRSVTPNRGHKPVALTFDLCETANEITGYDGSIVDYLRQQNIRATFFAGGKWMHSHPERAMQLMADPLFEIGNHTWTHGNLRVLTGQKMLDQILGTQGQYEILREDLESRYLERGGNPAEMERIPKVPLTFRFPFGTCSPEALSTLADLGLPAVQWDVVTGDPALGQSSEAISATVMSKTKPGSIIICHANGRGHHTAAALCKFIPALKAAGFEFVTISELLILGEPVSTKECYELTPGDNGRYDKIFGIGTGESDKNR